MLRDHDREAEHAAFLSWLIEQIAVGRMDALVVVGDVYDTSNPSASAEHQFYQLLADLRWQFPRLEIIVVAGNHDSGVRLDAPHPILSALQVHVVGYLPRLADGRLDEDRLIFPLRGRSGRVEAWIAAVPYLREADLPGNGLPYAERVRALYAELTQMMLKRRQPGQALLATGYGLVQSEDFCPRSSPESERRTQRASLHPIPPDVFPEALHYVALGHLHYPQTAGHPTRVYAGAPLPFSLEDGEHPHRVVQVSLDGENCQLQDLIIPTTVDILIQPSKEGAMTLAEAESWIDALPQRSDEILEWQRPYLELRILGASRIPGLWDRLARKLRHKAPRLIRLTDIRADALVERPIASLAELQPADVFRRRWLQLHPDTPVPEDVMDSFSLLLSQAQAETK